MAGLGAGLAVGGAAALPEGCDAEGDADTPSSDSKLTAGSVRVLQRGLPKLEGSGSKKSRAIQVISDLNCAFGSWLTMFSLTSKLIFSASMVFLRVKNRV